MPETEGPPLLQMTGIVKTFPGVRALGGVDLDVRAGEVHCLLGQNGAGKSTLIKVLAGAHRPDEGEITWDGEPVTLATPQASITRGISTIYQELDLVPGLTVAENIFLGHELSTSGFTRRIEARRAVRSLLSRLGHDEIRPDREVGQLSAAGQQVVSMARALSHDTRLIVMDEPSAVLDQNEVQNLFRVIRGLTAEGVAVVYISHRLEEIRQIGDRVTVLKDGRTVATGLAAAETPTSELIRLMTGREIEYVFPAAPRCRRPAPTSCSRWTASGSARRSPTCPSRSGPARSSGSPDWSGPAAPRSSSRCTARAVPTAALSACDGRRLRAGSVAAAVKAGVGPGPRGAQEPGPAARPCRLPERHRLQPGPVLPGRLPRPVRRARRGPAALGVARRTPDGRGPARAQPLGRQPAEGRPRPVGCCATARCCCSTSRRVASTSARAARSTSSVHSLAERGVAVVMVSSEVPEVLGLADRVLVVREGQVVHEGPAEEIDEHRVLDLVMEGSAA